MKKEHKKLIRISSAVTIASITIGIMITATNWIVKWMQELATRVLKHEKRRKSDAIKIAVMN